MYFSSVMSQLYRLEAWLISPLAKSAITCARNLLQNTSAEGGASERRLARACVMPG